MMGVRKLSIAVIIVVAASLMTVAVARAAGPRKGHADLSGYQEVISGGPSTLSTPATGSLDVTINKDGTALEYTLSYSGFETDVLQSHIHLGRPAIAGGIMVFLCTNLTPPAGQPTPPPCPAREGTVSGELSMADVGGGANAQGVAPGEFAELIEALLAEAAYGNVHTTRFQAGEIRGQIGFHGKGKDKD
jgi:CHRD domain